MDENTRINKFSKMKASQALLHTSIQRKARLNLIGTLVSHYMTRRAMSDYFAAYQDNEETDMILMRRFNNLNI